MNISMLSLKKKSLIVLGIAAAMGLTACNRPDGQMSDSAAANAPKESASLSAVLDDTAITAKVKQRIASDERVQKADIQVETNNGIVTLSGTAPTASAKSTVEELARNVAEVQGIDNKISAPSVLDDMGAKAESAVDRAGAKISDATITTKIKAELAADSQVKATEIKVDTDGGIVTLKGSVASADALDRALSIVRKVDGVKSIDSDRLKIVAQS